MAFKGTHSLYSLQIWTSLAEYFYSYMLTNLYIIKYSVEYNSRVSVPRFSRSQSECRPISNENHPLNHFIAQITFSFLEGNLLPSTCFHRQFIIQGPKVYQRYIYSLT